MKHKHYECIVAWAEGKDIQSWSTTRNDWIDFTHRTMIDWNFEPAKYRIKPEPTVKAFREVPINGYSKNYILRFYPSDAGWVCGISNEMMDAIEVKK